MGTKGVVAPAGETLPVLLMYNEPDETDQSAMCFENGAMSANAARSMATEYCTQVKEKNKLGYTEFGSPAFSQLPSNSDFLNKCVYPFFEEVAKDDECKSLTKHLVWHTYTSCDNQSNIESFCTSITDQWSTVYHKIMSDHGFDFNGMYITEFAGWWSNCVSESDPTGAAGQALVAQYCTAVLQQHQDVAGFAWFNDFGDYKGQGTSTSGTPTAPCPTSERLIGA